MPSNAYKILQDILAVFKGTPGNLVPPPRGMSNEESILYKIYKALVSGAASGPSTGVEEAPEDGNSYVRKNGAWVINETVVYASSNQVLDDSSGLDVDYRIIITNVSESTLTITTQGSDTLMGETSQEIYPDESFQLGLNGTDYRIL